MTLTYGSLFSGAGGFDLGFDRAGFRCLWQCEIDRTARSVLARHWPGVPQHEDVRALKPKKLERPDVLVGGFPCQDLSVAGKRAGLKGGRSGLFYELLRVVRGLRPRVLVWENVPGLFTSDGGRDFLRVLSALDGIGLAGGWRVLDAQHFGVPQRRKRVFGVFAFGAAGAELAAEVLALRDGLHGHPAAGEPAGADTASCLTGGSTGGGWGGSGGIEAASGGQLVVPRELASCLTAADGNHGYGSPRGDAGDNLIVAPGLAATLTGGSHQPGVNAPGRRREDDYNLVAFGGGSSHERAVDTALSCRGVRQDFETDTFVLPIDMRQASRGATMTNNRAEGSSGGPPGTGIGEFGDHAPSLCGTHNPAVFQWQGDANQAATPSSPRSAAPALGAATNPAVLSYQSRVRRLMPVERERLMSWPDDWTRWAADGREIADGPRYRMTGNGVVSNCAEWIARRLAVVLSRSRDRATPAAG